MEVCTHPQISLGREVLQRLYRHTVLVEELLRLIALEPLLDQLDMFRAVGLNRHLMGSPVVLHLEAVHLLRPCPSLWSPEYDHRPPWPLGLSLFPCCFLEALNLLDTEIQGVGKLPVHLGRVASLHKVWGPAAALEESLKLGMGNAGQHCGVCNLVSV